jgi:hypothetical protein
VFGIPQQAAERGIDMQVTAIERDMRNADGHFLESMPEGRRNLDPGSGLAVSPKVRGGPGR